MRTIIIATALSFLYLFSQSQNVGIGTTTPQVKLHVLKGIQTVAPNAGSTMAVQSDGQTFLQILSNSVSDQNGIYFGHTTQPISAGITFNYSGSRELAFFTNASAPSFVLNSQGNIGIGTLSPNAPLQFATSNQKRKIVLFETANNDNQFFGFGVFAGELRYQTGVATDDHVFYSAASSTASNELMRIKGDGNVGIGTSAPNAQLQFSNTIANRKIVFYEATNNDHQFNGFGLNPGVLRYQVNNTSDDHVFYAGTSATTSNELLRIKGNGVIAVNGSTGTAGQVLTSNGSGNATTWQSPASAVTILSDAKSANGTSAVFTSGSTLVEMPAMQLSLTTPQGFSERLLISGTVRAQTFGCSVSGCFPTVSLYLIIDGVWQSGSGIDITANTNNVQSMVMSNYPITVGAGTHTIKFAVVGGTNTNSVTVYPGFSSVTALPL
ncbi:MAG: hypothetical protein ABI594_08875 [Ginsengibacter sp.]